MIPLKIHQIWLNDTTPQRVLDSVTSWQQHAPQFTHILWRQPELEARFGKIEGEPAVRSNFYRVMIVGAEGGIYVDADTFAQPGAGESLASVAAGAQLIAATVAGQQSFDNTPLGGTADYPGWYELAQEPKLLALKWNQFLAQQTNFVTLPGWAWNASKSGPRVMIVHNRRTLSPQRPATPGVRIVLDTPDKKAAWKRGLIQQEPEDLQIVAMRKSGHHAVLRWLALQQGRETHHFNNCTAVDGCFRYVDAVNIPGAKPVLRACNFEDFALQEKLTGQRVLVIRSPLNCFASRIKGLDRFPNLTVADRAQWLNRDLWKAHAREYLGQTTLLGELRRVNFDRWHRSTADKRSEVLQPGESMFDATAFDGRAEEMDVLNRWQALREHPDMQPILADQELLDLWRQIEELP